MHPPDPHAVRLPGLLSCAKAAAAAALGSAAAIASVVRHAALAPVACFASLACVAPSSPPATLATRSPDVSPPWWLPAPVMGFPNTDRKPALLSALPGLEASARERFSRGEAPGAVVAVAIDGEVVLELPLGLADIEAARPMTPTTRFRIASITKTFTTLALAVLRDEGRLRLDDPLAAHLPVARYSPRFRDGKTVTLRDLLLHQSGLQSAGDYEEFPGAPPITPADLLRSLITIPSVAVPGSSYVYSNAAFGLLGLVIEQASGEPYELFLRRAVTAPLGLSTAAFSLAEIPLADRAVSYAKSGTRQSPLFEVELGAASASGGLYLSVPDLARWGAYHAEAYPPRDAPDTGPASRATVREILELYLDPAAVSAKSPTHHTLGWNAKLRCGTRFHWKAGALEEFSALVSFLPDHGIAIASAANGRLSLWDLHAALIDQLAGTGAMTARETAASAEVERAADALLALVESFDPAVYERLFDPYYRYLIDAETSRAFFQKQREEHGACRRARTTAAPHTRAATFELACEKTGVNLTLDLDGRGAKITMTSWKPLAATSSPAASEPACEAPWR